MCTVQGDIYTDKDVMESAKVVKGVTFYKCKICLGAQVEPGFRPEGSSVG